MTKTPWIIGAALAATLAATGYAYAMPEGGPPKTRAEVQAKIAEHFKVADANKDGFVTRAEFDAAREARKAKFAERREERRTERFAKLDTDKNGSISKAEFDAPRGDRGGKDGAEGMRGHGRGGPDGMRHGGRHHGGGMMRHGGMGMGQAWFDRADANKDGKVSLIEASTAPLAMFDKVDTNKDGTISPEEHEAARKEFRAKWQERRGDKG